MHIRINKYSYLHIDEASAKALQIVNGDRVKITVLRDELRVSKALDGDLSMATVNKSNAFHAGIALDDADILKMMFDIQKGFIYLSADPETGIAKISHIVRGGNRAHLQDDDEIRDDVSRADGDDNGNLAEIRAALEMLNAEISRSGGTPFIDENGQVRVKIITQVVI